MSGSPDMPTVAVMLADRMGDRARELVGSEPTARTRAALRFRSRHSLAGVVAGPKRGEWFDHGAGKGGDALGLVAHVRGIPMREAWRWALAWLGEAAILVAPPPRIGL